MKKKQRFGNKYLPLLIVVVSVLSTSMASPYPIDTTLSRPKNKEFVVLLHVFADNPFTICKIEKHLQKVRYSVLSFDYSSTKWAMETFWYNSRGTK